MIDIDTEIFTKNLKLLRSSQGFTQESLAEAIDTTHSTINRWESGQHSPSYKDFYKLMRALGVTFEELMGEAEIPKTRKTSPTIQESLKSIEEFTGILIRIPKGLTSIPQDIIEKSKEFERNDKVWEDVRGVFESANKAILKNKKSKKRA